MIFLERLQFTQWKNKSDAYESFVGFQKRAERFLNRKFDEIQTDGWLEFYNLEFKNILGKQGIAHEKKLLLTKN